MSRFFIGVDKLLVTLLYFWLVLSYILSAKPQLNIPKVCFKKHAILYIGTGTPTVYKRRLSGHQLWFRNQVGCPFLF